MRAGEAPKREGTIFDLAVPPDVKRRCEIYLQERLTWFGIERDPPPKGSPRDRQLRAAIREWWRALPSPEHERVFVHFVEQCLLDLVENGDIPEDVTPEQFSEAAIDEFARRVRALGVT
jgi:hypothetical protein